MMLLLLLLVLVTRRWSNREDAEQRSFLCAHGDVAAGVGSLCEELQASGGMDGTGDGVTRDADVGGGVDGAF